MTTILAGTLDTVGDGDGTLSGSLAMKIVGMRAGEIAAAAEQFTVGGCTR
jgi:hypothetical protein